MTGSRRTPRTPSVRCKGFCLPWLPNNPSNGAWGFYEGVLFFFFPVQASFQNLNLETVLPPPLPKTLPGSGPCSFSVPESLETACLFLILFCSFFFRKHSAYTETPAKAQRHEVWSWEQRLKRDARAGAVLRSWGAGGGTWGHFNFIQL